jgi:hypothetical protein
MITANISGKSCLWVLVLMRSDQNRAGSDDHGGNGSARLSDPP